MTELIAARLRDPEADRQGARVPVPADGRVRVGRRGRAGGGARALQDAMELSRSPTCRAIEGQVYVCPDVSGSMRVAGDRSPQGRDDGGALHRRGGAGGGGDAAAEPDGGGAAVRGAGRAGCGSRPRDSVMTNAEKLAAVGGGGTH